MGQRVFFIQSKTFIQIYQQKPFLFAFLFDQSLCNVEPQKTNKFICFWKGRLDTLKLLYFLGPFISSHAYSQQKKMSWQSFLYQGHAIRLFSLTMSIRTFGACLSDCICNCHKIQSVTDKCRNLYHSRRQAQYYYRDSITWGSHKYPAYLLSQSRHGYVDKLKFQMLITFFIILIKLNTNTDF